MYDYVIRNGQVVDGTGSPARAADIGIEDGTIVAVGDVEGTGTTEFDATGPVSYTHLDVYKRQADDGSVVVGLIEPPPVDAVVPLVIEHLDDLDVLLVVTEDGIASVDPGAVTATRLDRPMDPLTPVWAVDRLPAGTPVAGPEIAAWWRRDGAVPVSYTHLDVYKRQT